MGLKILREDDDFLISFYPNALLGLFLPPTVFAFITAIVCLRVIASLSSRLFYERYHWDASMQEVVGLCILYHLNYYLEGTTYLPT
jgi:hypothetical protein